MSIGNVLAFDVGSKWIGVAVGNTLTCSTNALGVQPADAWQHIDAWFKDYAPIFCVVGEPLRLEHDQNTEPQPALKRARAFAQQLHQRHDCLIQWMDERHTSQLAASRFAEARKLGQKKRKDADNIDAIAAQIILERWFDRNPPAF